jgi:cytoskeletal protein CcmA (bactofilin family)
MSVFPRSLKGSHHAIADQIQSATPGPQGQHPTASAGRSVISASLSVIGSLGGATDIQVDGKVEGDISGQAVKIGSGAVIKGTVTGEIVELAGKIEGKIEARSAVLSTTAHMSGDIVHQFLQIDRGACFNGNSRPIESWSVDQSKSRD